MNGVPLWVWIVGGLLVWLLLSIPFGMWLGEKLRRARELSEFAEWAREKHEAHQRGGLVIEFGHDRIRISSAENEQTIPIMPGTDVSLNVGPVKHKPDPDKDLH